MAWSYVYASRQFIVTLSREGNEGKKQKTKPQTDKIIKIGTTYSRLFMKDHLYIAIHFDCYFLSKYLRDTFI